MEIKTKIELNADDITRELKDYIIQESSYRGNIDVTYMETEDVYDVYLIE
jgi:hypothetical protein